VLSRLPPGIRRRSLRVVRGHPGVDPGVDLLADLVEEGFDDRGLVFGRKFAVCLGGGPDLVGRQR